MQDLNFFGMSTRTKRPVDNVKGVSIVTTRKIFPEAKEMLIKSILAM